MLARRLLLGHGTAQVCRLSTRGSITSAVATAVCGPCCPTTKAVRTAPLDWSFTFRFFHASLRRPQKQYYKLQKKKIEIHPFVVLGFDPPAPPSPTVAAAALNDETTTSLTYVQVKQRFLKIAMQHHPDTMGSSLTEDEKEHHRQVFIEARQAFEQIGACPQTGTALLKRDLNQDDDGMDDDAFAAWFQQESGGFDVPFMDLATMKEVAKMTETLGGECGGLDRDGGMWTLARMVSSNLKNGDGGAADLLRLEAGSVRNNHNGILRRKKRR
jgi:hypothetical protein